MLSRRAFLLSAVAASTASTLARSQTASQPSSGGSSAPTLLRLERRSIEVNGKPASVFGIRQPDGTFGIRVAARGARAAAGDAGDRVSQHVFFAKLGSSERDWICSIDRLQPNLRVIEKPSPLRRPDAHSTNGLRAFSASTA
jgi:hypothetical protein